MARSAARSPSTPDPRLALALRRLVLLGLLAAAPFLLPRLRARRTC